MGGTDACEVIAITGSAGCWQCLF